VSSGAVFDAGGVRVGVGAAFDPRGFDKYERAIRSARAEKDVETKLKADADTRGVDKYDRALDKSRKSADATERSHKKSGATMGAVWGAAGVVAGTATGVALAGAAIYKLVDAQSAIQESLSKNKVLFGSYSKDVEDFSNRSAKSYGISKQAVLEYTGTFGNLFRALGQSRKDASQNSVELTKLAADMASFNNTSTTEALDAIRSGLVGETEPLRKFGVNMNDATLKVEAHKLAKKGLIDASKANAQVLDPETNAMAAQSLIVKQTSAAHGDFARTSGGLANQQRILVASLQDAAAGLGKVFLPVVLTVVKGLNELIAGGGGGGVIGKVRGAFKGLGDFFKGDIADNVRGIGSSFADVGKQLLGFIQNVWSRVTATLGGDSGFVKDLHTIAFALTKAWGTWFGVMADIWRRVIPGIETAIGGLIQVARGFVRIIAGILTLDFGKAWAGIKDIIGGAIKVVGGVLRAATGPFREAASLAFSGIAAVARAIWKGIVGVAKSAIDTIAGAYSTLLGIAAKAASAASHVPGFGWLKDVADKARDAQKAIDGWRDSMQGRDADSKSSKRATELARELVKAKKALADTAVVSTDYRKKAQKVTDTQADLRDELKKAPSAAKTASKAIKGVGGSATQAAGEIAAAMTSIGENTNAILGGMGAPKVKYSIAGIKRQTFSGAGTGVDIGSNPGSAESITDPLFNARGGIIRRAVGGWIGRRGEAGVDDQQLYARPGDGILNRHQLPFVDHALAMFGRTLDPLLNRGSGSGTTPIIAARGEAHVPRESMGVIDGALRGVFGMGVDDLFATVTRPHSAPMFASGGGVPQLGHATMSGPGGSVQTGGQAALDKAIAAANKEIRKWAPLARMKRAMDGIDAKHFKYVYGGGHGSFSGPYDCSGLVSAILNAGGFLDSPITTDGLKTFGEAGDGKQITIGVRGSTGRSAHTMMKLGDRFLESGSGHGAQWVGGWSGNFPIHRHPPGFGRGGIITPEEYAKLPPEAQKALGWGMAVGGRVARWGQGVSKAELPSFARAAWDATERIIGSRLRAPKVRVTDQGAPSNAYAWFDTRTGAISLTRAMGRALANPKSSDHAYALSSLVHEYAHANQRADVAASGPKWKREGGAESFAQWATPRVMTDLGMKFRRSPIAYWPFVKRVNNELGSKWVRSGQFAHVDGKARFAGGGNVVGRRANILHRRLGLYDRKIQDATDLDTRYQQLDRAFNFTEETFQKDDGSLDVGAIRHRWLELGRLMDIRAKVIDAYQEARKVVVRAIRDLREFIARVRKALAGSHGKKGKKRRQHYRDALEIAGEDLSTWRDNLHTLDVNTIPDQKLDLRDLGHERASLMGLKAEVKEPDKVDATDTSSDTSGGASPDTPDVPDTSTSTEPVQTAPSAEQIAEAARQQFESFTKGRADLFASFGSNFMSTAVRDATIDAAGVRFFGATSSGDAREQAAGRSVTVTNVFPTPPPDPHTWSRQQEFELNAL